MPQIEQEVSRFGAKETIFGQVPRLELRGEGRAVTHMPVFFMLTKVHCPKNPKKTTNISNKNGYDSGYKLTPQGQHEEPTGRF